MGRSIRTSSPRRRSFARRWRARSLTSNIASRKISRKGWISKAQSEATRIRAHLKDPGAGALRRRCFPKLRASPWPPGGTMKKGLRSYVFDAGRTASRTPVPQRTVRRAMAIFWPHGRHTPVRAGRARMLRMRSRFLKAALRLRCAWHGGRLPRWAADGSMPDRGGLAAFVGFRKLCAWRSRSLGETRSPRVRTLKY